MIFSIIILVLLLAVSFFQYVQGFLSATLSAFLCVVAAVLAMSYHEPLVEMLLKGKYADQANAIALCVLFATIYIVLRILFDKLIPGNIRVPVMAEKIGAGAMGLVVGIYSTGIVAIAAQMLPFGPTVGGYSRYTVIDERDTIIPDRRSNQENAWVLGETKGDTFVEADAESLLIPVDDMVVGTVAVLSADGSLAGARSLESVHPNYLDELFGQRVGLPLPSRRTAPSVGGASAMEISSANLLALPAVEVPQVDIEPLTRPESLAETPNYASADALIVLRAKISRSAADVADSMLRITPAAVRLVIDSKNYYPIGRLEDGKILRQRIDDVLPYSLKESDFAVIDFVYEIPPDVFPGGLQGAAPKFPSGAFVEAKRFARVDLSGTAIQPVPPGSGATPAMRKVLPQNWTTGRPR